MASGTILLENADVVVTMNDAMEELPQASLLVRDGVIVAINPDRVPPDAQRVSVAGCILTPGLVNTHHHMFQSLTRAVPGGQDALLFGWLKTLYPIWGRMGPEEIFVSTQLALSELALSGCSMSSDHLYLFPGGATLDDSIAAAAETGMRFHPTRGSMSIGESNGGLPPDSLTEAEPAILEDCIRLADRYHDASDGAMLRIGFAPCSPFSVSRELMRDSAVLARDKGVMLHTHLAENTEDIAYSQENFGCRPGAYAKSLGWVGQDVWHAHCVKLDTSEIDLFARTGTGVAHCPCSNCRLGSGIAPVRQMRDAGVRVGLGVDGSASNDAADLIAEARMAMLLQRVAQGADAFSARAALRLATRGGAEVLGRGDCGILAPGYRADIAVWPATTLAQAGNWDPVAALVLCQPPPVRDLMVEGRWVVRAGRMQGVDQDKVSRNARALALQLVTD